MEGRKGDAGPPGPRGDAGDRGPRGRIGIYSDTTTLYTSNCIYIQL